MEFISKSEDETKQFAKVFASKLDNNSIVLLCGDLGSGKTKFTEGILSYFGLENEISSPTFTIVNEYSKDNIKIFHFDLYRLSDIDEFYAIGGDEYFGNGICIIEWGELLENELNMPFTKIKFSLDEQIPNYRKLEKSRTPD